MAEIDKVADIVDEYLNALPPVNFEQTYMPDGTLDKQALMGAAYEEMGKKQVQILWH